MKRYSVPLAILLIVILLLTACGSNTATTSTTSTTTTAPTSTAKPSTTTPATTSTTTTVPPTSQPPTSTISTTTLTTPAPGQVVTGGIFNMMQDSTITNIQPPADGGTLLLRALLPALEPLLRFNAKGILEGYLAESWTVAADGSNVTLNLRKGIKFHDGTDFNAQAVKYNLEATLKSGLAGSSVLASVKSYDIVNDNTLRLNLSGFDYRLMSSLAGVVGLIASPTALQKPSTPENIAQLHMVGTGPFLFDSWKRDDFVKYKKNPNYWQPGKPYLDGVILRYIADRTVAVMSFRAGDSNCIVGVDPVNADLLEKNGAKITIAGLRFQHAMMTDSANPKSPFANAKVREALHWALDKQKLIDGIGGGAARGYTILDQMAEATDPWYVPDLPYRTNNPTKAKQLLAEAGYPNGFKSKLTTNPLVEQGWPEALQTEFKKVGIDLTIEVADVPRFTSLTMSGWEGLVHPGFPTFSTIGGLYFRWGDPAQFVSMYRPAGWNEKWKQVLSVTDEKQRMDIMKDLVRMEYNESVGFSYRANAPIGADMGNIHNFVLHAGSNIDVWWPEQVWMDKK